MNTLHSFQSYIQGVLKFFFDITIIHPLDDVLLFLYNLSQNGKYVQKVIKDNLNVVIYMRFSRFILKHKVVEMEKDCISTILNYPRSQSVCEILSFLKLVNFYQRSVKKILKMA